MLRKTFFLISLFLFITFQVFFVSNIFSAQNAPNFVLLLIIFWTIKRGFEKTLKLVIFSGIILDIFYFWPIGTNVLSLVIVSYLTSFLTRRFSIADFFSRSILAILIVSFSIVINDFLNQITFKAIYFFQRKDEFSFYFEWNIWRKIIYNLIMFAIIFWPLKKIEALSTFYKFKKNPKYYVK